AQAAEARAQAAEAAAQAAREPGPQQPAGQPGGMQPGVNRLIDTTVLGKPRDFNGEPGTWRDWSTIFRADSSACEPALTELMERAEHSDEPVLNATLPEEQELLSWDFEGDVPSKLIAFDRNVKRYEQVVGTEFPDEIKIGILVRSLKEDPLRHHLLLNSQRLDTWELVKAEVENFRRAQIATTASAGAGLAPMDIGSLAKQLAALGFKGGRIGKIGNGKGKIGKLGKGRGKGKDDGKTGNVPKPRPCWTCGSTAHLRKDCPVAKKAGTIGEPIHDEGQRKLMVQTGGALRGIRARVAGVRRPLLSVLDLVKSGHRMVFEQDQYGTDISHAVHVESVKMVRFTQRQRTWDLDVSIDEFQPAPVRGRRGPKEPTQAALEQREAAGHAPFWDWCYCCLAGRGRADSRPAGAPGRAHAIPTIAVDYGYPVKREEVERGQSVLPILVGIGSASSRVNADVLPFRGIQHECKVVRAFGQATSRLRNVKIEVVPEQAPAYDSASNGLAEVAVREVKGVARPLRVALSLLRGVDNPNDHPVLTWLVARAAGCVDRGEIGADGWAPRERPKGKAFCKVLPPFGEIIVFLPGTRRETKCEGRWADAALLLSIRGAPWMPTPVKPESVRIPTVIDEPPVDAAVQQSRVVPEQVPAEPRNVYIRWSVEPAKYGITDGCPECRERIQQAVTDDPELAPRAFGAAARRLEAADRAPARQGGAGAGAPVCAARAAEAPMEIERPGRQAVPRRGSPAELPQAPATPPAQAAGPSGLLQAPPGARGSTGADSLELCALLAAIGDWRVAVSELCGPGRFASRSSQPHREAGDWMIREIAEMPGVHCVECDQCAYGLCCNDAIGPAPVKKPTGWLTNSDEIAWELTRRCPGCVRHCKTVGLGRRGVRAIERCPPGLVAAVLRGLRREAVARGQLGALEARPRLDEPPVWDAYPEYYAEIVDNISGAALDPELVAAGRKEEMEFLRGLGAYACDSKQRGREETGRDPVPMVWVDVNKGDERKPNVHCRPCVAETRYRASMHLGGPSQTFSATPPCEALRMLISFCCSPWNVEEDHRVLMFLGVARAHPHCEMKRKLWVKLPQARTSQLLVCETLEGKMGFACGVWCPCIYRSGDGKLVAYVYGDIFVLKGSRSDNLEFHRELQKHMWVKLECMLGPNKSSDNVQEVACLNRIFRWTSRGDVELEAGSRRALVMLQQLGLWRESNALTTPGVKPKSADRGRVLEGDEATRYRSLAMRVSYLSKDRPDIKYAVKEAAMCMHEPCEHGVERVKRIARCGVFQLGNHVIKALVHAASCGIGLVSLARDMRYELELCLAGDATVACGIAHLRGAGRIRHIETKTLWLQRHVTERRVLLSKTPGRVNVADLGTKHLTQKELDEMLELLGFYVATGRSGLAFAIAGNLLEPEPACDREGDEEMQA
ncbi:unnamed protein product, partial [Prorocentrum cordatum]